jgi:hypothetical protein
MMNLLRYGGMTVMDKLFYIGVGIVLSLYFPGLMDYAQSLIDTIVSALNNANLERSVNYENI